MRIYVLPAILLICAYLIPVAACHAQTRKYEVYKTDRYGNKQNILRPDAIIEVDDLTGRAEVYETDRYGFPDITQRPSYVIEASPFNVPLYSSLSSDKDCDDDDSINRRHRHHHYDEDEDDDF
jgi:hypothetical protein